MYLPAKRASRCRGEALVLSKLASSDSKMQLLLRYRRPHLQAVHVHRLWRQFQQLPQSGGVPYLLREVGVQRWYAAARRLC